MLRKGRVHVKPSKPAALMGVIMGVIFVIIGITQVIPSIGLFGVFWTLMALVITGFSVYNLVSDKGAGYYEVDLEQVPADREPREAVREAAAAENDFETRLRKVEKLYSDGIITHDEYEQKRAEILQEKW